MQTIERFNSRTATWEKITGAASTRFGESPAKARRGRTPKKEKLVAASSVQPAQRGRHSRMYNSARGGFSMADWPTSNNSADAELSSSLTVLRSRSRALVRDSAYAKRAKVIIQNNVVGSGIGLQAQVKTTRDALNDRINDAIEQAFEEWSCADSCHTGGALHFADLERAAIGQVFAAGEVFFRKRFTPFGDSDVPYALELIEAERLADDLHVPGPAMEGANIRMGVEMDVYYRPIAYWLRQRHPGEVRVGLAQTDYFERVPASQIIHLRIVDRWPQTRGEPWLHAVVRKLNDMDAYSEAEIVAARAAASYMGFITTPDATNPLADGTNTDGTNIHTLKPGTIDTLAPGESFTGFAPNRPNPNADPFMRMMLREAAAGVGVSYESLSRDYSQSNYSSSRLALLDDRDLWRVLQGWFIRNFRQIVHREWLQQAVLAGAIPEIPLGEYGANQSKFEAVLYKPRGWSWVDPTKEVEAYKQAVRCGFMTVGDVITQTNGGLDLEDVLKGRRRELDKMHDENLRFDTDPEVNLKAVPVQEGQPTATPAAQAGTESDSSNANNSDQPARVVSIKERK